MSNPQDEKTAYIKHKSLWGGWSESIDEMIAEGDRVMVRWTFHGVHEGEWQQLGILPETTELIN